MGGLPAPAAEQVSDLLQVKLLSSDSQSFEVDIEVAKQSQTLRDTIEGEATRAWDDPRVLFRARARDWRPDRAEMRPWAPVPRAPG